LDSAGALIVMGGPMNVDELGKYPFLEKEIGWLRQATAMNLPVLGICLGSQLLAKSLGARVYANGIKEIGWYPVEVMPEGETDPLFAGSGPRETVFQWHGDTFDLPPGAVQLARSERCRHQAFRWGRNAYGFQFHIEVTPEMVETWLEEPENRCELKSLEYIDPDEIRVETGRRFPEMRALGERVLPRFLAMCGS
jgi:GMP synthase (glutamine-hydrolysing)